MSVNLEETAKQLIDFLKMETKTETIVGQAFQLGEFTCVPVVRLGMGLGYGGGEGQGDISGKGKGEGTGTGSGATGGMGISPIGFLVTRGDQISFIPTHTSRGLGAAFEKVPDLLEKMLEKKNGKATVS
ncbi:GerW family sporulation protein [Chitinophaga agri]|uniref:Sporulation protein n=1 Tax=Chitinophaga agri TaxID=2703787 RepID=A0A6B9ZCR2_9BACT|nr:GerW family sporulation protein [Chitinophaga agri]QHS58905.1 sporulation protein [Chitinophaga agri]